MHVHVHVHVHMHVHVHVHVRGGAHAGFARLYHRGLPTRARMVWRRPYHLVRVARVRLRG